MKIDNNLILKLENLSRLKLSEDERVSMISNLSDMLKLVEKLEELPTDNVEPLIYMNEDVDVMRGDVAQTTVTQQEALKNAPKKDSDYFKVPKVIDQK